MKVQKRYKLMGCISAILAFSGCANDQMPFHNKMHRVSEQCFLPNTEQAEQLVSSQQPQTAFGEKVLARYVVKRGDTLWGIAARFLERPWYWKQIWYNNPQIKNPNLIYPGDEISVVEISGERRLTISNANPTYHGNDTGHSTKSGLKIYKYRPQMSVEQIDNEPVTIMGKAIEPLIKMVSVIPTSELASLPVVFAGNGEYVTMTSQQVLYVKSLPKDAEVFTVYQVGKSFDDENNPGAEQATMIYGVAIVKYIGRDTETGLYKLKPLSIIKPIRDGDVLGVMDTTDVNEEYVPRMPTSLCTLGNMIVNGDKESVSVKQFDTVVTSFGADNEAQIGDIWRIVEPGNNVNIQDESLRLPSRTLGYLMITKVYPKYSLGFVLSSIRNIDINAWLVRPD